MATLQEQPTLLDLQIYLRELCAERGWDKNTDLEIFLLFSEEIGELAKAIRDYHALYQEKGKEKPAESVKTALAHEFADVLSYLLDLANHFDVDLEQAFREKEAINQRRNWG